MVAYVKNQKKFDKHIEYFHDFIIGTHEHVSELRKLQIDSTLTKEKQKSQAKSILQQKKKALTDVFKTLKNFGYSYQVGQRELQLSKFKEMFNVMKPINLFDFFMNLKQM